MCTPLETALAVDATNCFLSCPSCEGSGAPTHARDQGHSLLLTDAVHVDRRKSEFHYCISRSSNPRLETVRYLSSADLANKHVVLKADPGSSYPAILKYGVRVIVHPHPFMDTRICAIRDSGTQVIGNLQHRLSGSSDIYASILLPIWTSAQLLVKCSVHHLLISKFTPGA